MVKINSTRETVRKVLVEFEETRDNVHKLVAFIWNVERKEDKTVDFLRSLYLGRYSSIHSIERQSRFLQKEFPEIRGKFWAKRQNHQKKVKEDLGYFEELKN